MSHYVGLAVMFIDDDSDALAVLAKRYLEQWETLEVLDSDFYPSDYLDDLFPEVAQFLAAAASGRNTSCGNKGCLFTWGIIGNYTNVGRFVLVLGDFWATLLKQHLTPRILVFKSEEEVESSEVWELSHSDGAVRVKHLTELPFWLLI